MPFSLLLLRAPPPPLVSEGALVTLWLMLPDGAGPARGRSLLPAQASFLSDGPLHRLYFTLGGGGIPSPPSPKLARFAREWVSHYVAPPCLTLLPVWGAWVAFGRGGSHSAG